MSENQSSFKQIFKATSIFGGVQVFNILISIIRAKFIAVIVGPAGIGLFGLLTSTISLITSVTSFGLGTSSVKDISLANKEDNSNNNKLSETIGVLNKLVWFTGGLGMILTLILSPLLSKLTFDNYDYTWSFVFLSITLFLGQLTLGKDAVLQGTRQLKWLAYANMLSSVISLLVTFPLYFIYGIDGVVPGIIIMSVMTLIITQFFYSKLKFVIPNINFKETWEKGNGMLKFGFFLSLSGIISTVCSYFLRIFITRYGGLESVGLYSAGFGIITSYVGIVLTAMATDYYPRLSGSTNEDGKFKSIVNHQGIVALLILGPIITLFIVFTNQIVIILYSREFLLMTMMMKYAIIGIFFRAAAWLLGFILLAKGSTKLFFWSELSANIYTTLINCIFYYFWKLDGLGIAFTLSYILYLLQMICICKRFYGFSFDKEFVKLFSIHFILSVVTFILITTVQNKLVSYFLEFIMVLASIIFSIYHVNKIFNLKEIISKKYKKND